MFGDRRKGLLSKSGIGIPYSVTAEAILREYATVFCIVQFCYTAVTVGSVAGTLLAQKLMPKKIPGKYSTVPIDLLAGRTISAGLVMC